MGGGESAPERDGPWMSRQRQDTNHISGEHLTEINLRDMAASDIYPNLWSLTPSFTEICKFVSAIIL